MKLKNNVYFAYAFEPDENKYTKHNSELYDELSKIYKVKQIALWKNKISETKNEIDEAVERYDIVVTNEAVYGHNEYKVYKKPGGLPIEQVLLLCSNVGLVSLTYPPTNDRFFEISGGC